MYLSICAQHINVIGPPRSHNNRLSIVTRTSYHIVPMIGLYTDYCAPTRQTMAHRHAVLHRCHNSHIRQYLLKRFYDNAPVSLACSSINARSRAAAERIYGTRAGLVGVYDNYKLEDSTLVNTHGA